MKALGLHSTRPIVATGSADGVVRLFDTRKNTALQSLHAHGPKRGGDGVSLLKRKGFQKILKLFEKSWKNLEKSWIVLEKSWKIFNFFEIIWKILEESWKILNF